MRPQTLRRWISSVGALLLGLSMTFGADVASGGAPAARDYWLRVWSTSVLSEVCVGDQVRLLGLLTEVKSTPGGVRLNPPAGGTRHTISVSGATKGSISPQQVQRTGRGIEPLAVFRYTAGEEGDEHLTFRVELVDPATGARSSVSQSVAITIRECDFEVDLTYAESVTLSGAGIKWAGITPESVRLARSADGSYTTSAAFSFRLEVRHEACLVTSPYTRSQAHFSGRFVDDSLLRLTVTFEPQVSLLMTYSCPAGSYTQSEDWLIGFFLGPVTFDILIDQIPGLFDQHVDGWSTPLLGGPGGDFTLFIRWNRGNQ